MRKNFDEISQKEIQKLMSYDWPGNVRELENIIERGAILSVPPTFHTPELLIQYSATNEPTSVDSLDEVNRRHILMTLQKTNWKIRGNGGAASLLDIKPTTLEFRMKKLGIRRPHRTNNKE